MRSLSSWPRKSISKRDVQPKLCFITWEATWGKILTLDQLWKTGLALANRCCIYQESEETGDHILLRCIKTRVLWELLISLFSMPWVFLGFKTLFWDRSVLSLQKSREEFGKRVPLVYFKQFGRLGLAFNLGMRGCAHKRLCLFLYICFGWRPNRFLWVVLQPLWISLIGWDLGELGWILYMLFVIVRGWINLSVPFRLHYRRLFLNILLFLLIENNNTNNNNNNNNNNGKARK